MLQVPFACSCSVIVALFETMLLDVTHRDLFIRTYTYCLYDFLNTMQIKDTVCGKSSQMIQNFAESNTHYDVILM